MDNREQTNQPQTTEARVERLRRQTARRAQEAGEVRANKLAIVSRRFNDIESQLKSSTRVPFKNNLSMVDVSRLLDLLSELRSSLPEALEEATEIVRTKQEIETLSEQRAQERKSNADAEARQKLEIAEANTKKMIEDAQIRANEIEQQARATAERLLVQANADAQQRTEESEIVCRANARAREIYDQVQMDTDGVYKTAYTEVNKMLSGATAALNRSALELAALRDQLLNSMPNSMANGNGDQTQR